MAKIRITRKKNWCIGDRVFEVYAGDQRIGYLSNGESNEFDLPLGRHKLKVKMGRYGSNDLEYNFYNKEFRSFNVSINYLPIIVFAIAMPGGIILQNILRESHKGEAMYNYLFLVIILLMGIYWQTIGRNTYLKLREMQC